MVDLELGDNFWARLHPGGVLARLEPTRTPGATMGTSHFGDCCAVGGTGRSNLPKAPGAVSTRRDHGELGGAVGGECRIAGRHALDDPGFRIALVHEFACLSGDRAGDSRVLVGNAGLRERC